MRAIPSDERLTKEITALRGAIVKAETRWSRSMQTRWQLALSFLKGVLSALGALAVLVIVTPLVVWFLREIQWPPIIEDIVSKVILQIEQVNRQSPPGAAGQ
ncbi:MAG: hypothetical protein WC840_05970 [Candidatus Peribacteraceae bacterium]